MVKTLSLFVCSVAAAMCAAAQKCAPFAPGEVSLGEDGPFAAAARTNSEYLLKELDPARLVAEFRRQAGLPRKADRYGGWEANQGAGHAAGHCLSALSLLYARTKDHEAKRRVDYIVEELWECQLANKDGYCLPVPKDKVWDRVKAGDFSAGEFDVCRWWRPLYTLDKVMRGLRDAHRAAGNAKALEVERRLADWLLGVVAKLDDAQMQKLLVSEWGELNGTLADLYADTKEKRYLDAAKSKFFDKRAFEPLSRGEDRLDGASARAMSEKAAGLARVGLVDGNAGTVKAARTFWDAVAGNRAFPTGAFGNRERFFPQKDAERNLGNECGEMCAVCAMLRTSASLFCEDPTSDKMDYVERALVNCVLSGVGRKGGEFLFYQSLKPVAEKAFSHGHHVWTCCVGEGVEAPERFAESAYFRSGSSIWVNLFIDSSVAWRSKGVVLTQRTKFPESDKTTISIACKEPVKFKMLIRKPAWCSAPALNVCGAPKSSSPDADGYIVVDRTWSDGDTVVMDFPMKSRCETYADGKFAAFAKGPQILAGITEPEFGKEDFAKSRWGDNPHTAPGGTDEPARAVLASGGTPRPPVGMNFMPLWKVYEEHYTVLFPVCAAAEFQKRENARRDAEKALAARKASVVDQVVIGWWPDEEAHRWNGAHDTVGENRGRKFRHAPGESGRFMYELEVDPKAKQYVEATFWGDDNGRTFELCVDWKVIATISLERKHPGQFFTERFEIPRELTAGKERVMVCFRGKKGKTWTGAVFSLAIVK